MAGRHGKTVRRRAEWLLIAFMLLYVAIAGRLFFVQVYDNERYCQFAEKVRSSHNVLPANRGVIYDRLGREFATNVPACAIKAHPQKVKDRERTAALIAAAMGTNGVRIEQALSSGREFVYLGRQLPPDVGDKIREANLAAVGVDRETKRVYPSGSLAAHVIGFTNIDGRGLEGVERIADAELRGKDGYEAGEVDANRRIIPETMRKSVRPIDGKDVVLTIDAYLQHVTEEALGKSFEAHNAVGATAIVMDPHTGEILALANYPTFDPNNRKGVSWDACRNRAVTDVFEPGSTLKLITVAAGLEEGMSPTETLTTCTNGGMQIGRRRVRCSLHEPYMAGHGGIDMFGVIRHSCNIGAGTIALKLGPDKMHSYVKAFGLLDRPGSGLSGETAMGLGSPGNWSAMRLCNIGFGQGVAVSAIQMASAYSVIANGGELMRPQIIREIRGKDGDVVQSFHPKVVRRVVSEETARQATEMLIGCVEEGTGKPSKVDCYSIAGKTGSAQKASTTGRGYAAGKFIASFMGFAPARNPRVVICVVVDEPKGTHWGATVAAPVFQEIAAKAMWYLRVPPDEQPNEKVPGSSVSVKRIRGKFGAGQAG